MHGDEICGGSQGGRRHGVQECYCLLRRCMRILRREVRDLQVP
jgi:hypothetical protein